MREEWKVNKRLQIYLVIWSFYTTINIFLLRILETSGDLREGIEKNFRRDIGWQDIVCLAVVFLLVYSISFWLVKIGLPFLRTRFSTSYKPSERHVKFCQRRYLWIFILGVWFVFFLVFYPGTAMNDTINVLSNPFESSAQHPIIYNLYTYGLYSLGKIFGNSNLGLAMISVIQIVSFSYVLALILEKCHQLGVSARICIILLFYFSFAPIFPTYAISAIKDTPFTICLLYAMYYLCENGANEECKFWRASLFLSFFGVAAFRSNGKYIVLLWVVCALVHYKKRGLRIFVSGILAVVLTIGLSNILTPEEVKPWFQESVGMQIQQLGATVAYDGEMLSEDREYLFSILPEKEWKKYTPCCADTIKWNKYFDRNQLNKTKIQFLRAWCRTFPKNIRIYADAYLLDSYGVWGIETRNCEQYYFKDIYPNELGLEQKSLVPEPLHKLIYKYFCNRFTYRYLSAGTAIWFLLAVSLYLLYKREYQRGILLIPIWGIWLTLMLETPIAFCFRYMFILEIIVPVAFVSIACSRDVPFVLRSAHCPVQV